MKIEVNWDLCESNGVCVDIVPSVFDINDDDELEVTKDAITADLRADLEEAVRLCPRQALTLVD